MVVGLDRKRRLVHGQRAVGRSDRVVAQLAVGIVQAGHDGIAADRRGRGGCAAVVGRDVLAVLDSGQGAG